ncbi:type II CAAX endopeptidase family protein [Kineothrix sedimenti]|uniref:Type II CAAX endopeptidase family protein n=1 Tax=Kineothrix sedimenti TaxID=3123317 RepID=A0ABZ3EUV5_9FIRM
MNSKKVNRIFLAVILLHVGAVVLLGVLSPFYTLTIVPNFIISQLIVLVPALIGLLISGENLIKLVGFRRIKISSVLMIILFTFLAMPLTTVINAVSMLFVDNTVVAISGDILEIPFFVMLLIIGIIGPFSEELVFRGIIYQGYKKSGTVLQALFLSACLFALMHMNFNQAAYALIIGMILVALVEATGSLWSSVLFHVIFNSQQVCIMYLYDSFGMGGLDEAQSQITTDIMLAAISGYLIIAAITTTLAACVLAWIAKNEHREENLRDIWRTRKNKTGNTMVTVPLLIAVVSAFSYMALDFILY